MENNLLSVSQAAEALGVSLATVRRLADAGKLPVIKNGQTRYFTREVLENWKEQKNLTIAEAAERTGVSAATLRRHEQEGLISPPRNELGERVYTQEVLEEYQVVREQKKEILKQQAARRLKKPTKAVWLLPVGSLALLLLVAGWVLSRDEVINPPTADNLTPGIRRDLSLPRRGEETPLYADAKITAAPGNGQVLGVSTYFDQNQQFTLTAPSNFTVNLDEDKTYFRVQDHGADVFRVDYDKNVTLMPGSTLHILGTLRDAQGKRGEVGQIFTSQGSTGSPLWQDQVNLIAGDLHCEDCITSQEIGVLADLSVSGVTTFNSVAYSWPSLDGANQQFLQTNGEGTLSWSILSGGNLSDFNIVSPTSGQILIYDGTDSWDNKSVSGDATLSSAGVLTISCTDCLNATQIEDIYLLNTGDTATGDYNFASNTLFVDSVNGRVGVGVVPTTGVLQVVGQCVTGDTRLRRKRKKKKKGQSEWEEVPIKKIKAGDEVLSLDEKTGELVWRRVKDIKNMPPQVSYQMVTQSGKKIRTTAEHPYLALPKRARRVKSASSGVFTVDQSNRIEEWEKDSVIALANEDQAFTVTLKAADKLRIRQRNYASRRKLMGPEVWALVIATMVRRGGIRATRLILDQEYKKYERRITRIIARFLPEVVIEIKSIGKLSAAHKAAWGEANKKGKTPYNGVLQKAMSSSELSGSLDSELLHPGLDTGDSQPTEPMATPYGSKNKMSSAQWTQAQYLKPGVRIATTAGWEPIVAIFPIGTTEKMWDIEIEETANFVGNDIVAHNTYLNGALDVTGNTSLGDAAGDSITFNADSLTFANDTAVALSGGVNGINFDSDTLSIDAENNRVGVGTAAPGYNLSFGTTLFTSGGKLALYELSGSNLYGFGVTAGALDVYANATQVVRAMETGILAFPDITSNTKLQLYSGYGLGVQGGQFRLHTDGSSTDFLFLAGAAGTELLRIKGSGHVGIGDTTPAAHLVVGSDATAGFADGIGDVYILGDLEVDSDIYLNNEALLATVLGTRSYTEDNYVTDSESFTSSVDALDQAVSDLATGTSGIWTDGGAITYLTSQTDDLALGGTSSTSPFFFDESAELLTLTSTTALLRLGYDATNYWSATVASNGNLTFTPATGGLITVGSAGSGTLSVPGSGSNSEQFGAGASGTNSLAIGNSSSAGSTGNIALGYNAQATGHISMIVIGRNASGGGTIYRGITIGDSAAGGQQAVVIGGGAASSGNYNVAIGDDINAGGSSVIAIGRDVTTGNNGIVAIGDSVNTGSSTIDAVAIGRSATMGTSNHYSIVLGAYATSSAANQLVIGSATAGITQGYLGEGVTSTTPGAITLNATGGSGTDIAGGALQLAGGKGTGSGAGGDIVFLTAAPGVSGSSLNSLATRLTIDDATGNATFTQQVNAGTSGDGLVTKVVAGACDDSAFTTDTDGLICLDSSNGRIYFRYGGAWHYSAQTAGFQIPNLVWKGVNETEGLKVGDYVVGKLDQKLSDGALHGIYVNLNEVLDERIAAALAKLTTPSNSPSLEGESQNFLPSGEGRPGGVLTLDSLVVKEALSVHGNLNILGTLSLSKQQGGRLTIPAGETKATVSFTKPYGDVPVVTVSSLNSFVRTRMAAVNKERFVLEIEEALAEEAEFSWLALPVKELSASEYGEAVKKNSPRLPDGQAQEEEEKIEDEPVEEVVVIPSPIVSPPPSTEEL
jgi:excisionase family DNA binding protein